MLRGLTTVTYLADDLTAARDWYTDLLGIEPYFEREADGEPAYLEYRLGDLLHELGLLSTRFLAQRDAAGIAAGGITYWAVDDVDAALARLLGKGATLHQPAVERGPGYVTASVVDPFGNVLGVMLNQHYLDVVGKVGRV
jgi:catechol 2,3-dioxygenase-like lactoylglutathione lyase family enzyme